jgi:tetratricopeptide (TPR) repeat protein
MKTIYIFCGLLFFCLQVHAQKRAFLDTLGKKHKIAYRVEDLRSDITALIFPGTGDMSKSFPIAAVLKHKQLEVFIIQDWNGSNDFQKFVDNISKLPNLKILSMVCSRVSSLPNNIDLLKNLTHLSVYYNQSLDDEGFPTAIGRLRKLQVLNVGATKITEIKVKEIQKLLPNCKIETNITADTYRDVASVAFMYRKYEIALAYCLQAISLGMTEFIPNASDCYKQIAYEAFDRGEYRKAIDYFLKSVLKNDKTTYSAYSSVGLCYLLLKEPKLDSASFYFHKHEEVDDKKLLPLKGLAETYSKLKDYKKAYSYTHKILALEPNDTSAWFDLSYYALFVGKPEESIKAAKKTLLLDSEKKAVESNLALGYLLNNQYAEANKIYLKWKGKKFNKKDADLSNKFFLQDITNLEQANINHKDFEKVKALFR